MDRQRTALLTPAAQSQTTEDVGPEHFQIITTGPGDSNGVSARDSTRPETSSTERHLLSAVSEGQPMLPQSNENPLADFERVPPPPPARSRDGHGRRHSNRHNLLSHIGLPAGNGSGVDWIVPVDAKDHTRRTVGERLEPTIRNAEIERNKFARKAVWTGYSLNIAIGLQVFLGALTTGIAAAVTNIKQAQVSTSVLGGLATLVASYLARARGSGEPELSIARVKDLEQFLRECLAFQIDHAHEYTVPGDYLDMRVIDLRRRFEEMLGNVNAERKLSPVGVSTVQAA